MASAQVDKNFVSRVCDELTRLRFRQFCLSQSDKAEETSLKRLRLALIEINVFYSTQTETSRIETEGVSLFSAMVASLGMPTTWGHIQEAGGN